MMSDLFLKLLGFATKAGKIAIGTQAVKIAIKKKKAFLVIASKECSQNTVKEIIKLDSSIRIIKSYSSDEISKFTGKYNRHLVAILSKQMAETMIKEVFYEKN